MFVDGYKEGLVVNHKDGNKLNNNASNLEWVTSSYNNKHAFDIGLKRKGVHENCRKACIEKTSIKVKCIDINTGVEKTFRSMKQAAKEIGGTGAGIKYSIKNNKPYKKRYLFYEIYIR